MINVRDTICDHGVLWHLNCSLCGRWVSKGKQEDSFLHDLNAAIAEIPRLPRVRFETGLGDDAEIWIKRKHANGAVHEPAMLGAFLAIARRYRCKTVFDCGALYGYFTLAAAGLFPDAEITAFEMHSAAIGPLARNVWPSAQCVHAVLSDECEAGRLIWVSGFNIFEKPDGGWDALNTVPGALKPRGEGNRGRGFVRANFITLDRYCETNSPPDLLKIDVEGYQAKAIAGGMGMIRQHRPVIVIELHDPDKLARFGTSNAATVKPLFDIGYQAFWCGNFRDADARFEKIEAMDERHERLSLMVFADAPQAVAVAA
jgi:FkbM family methyltransferase